MELGNKLDQVALGRFESQYSIYWCREYRIDNCAHQPRTKDRV